MGDIKASNNQLITYKEAETHMHYLCQINISVSCEQ